MELCPVGSNAGIGCFSLDLVQGVPERNRKRERSIPSENSRFPAGSRSQVPRGDLRKPACRGSLVLGTREGTKQNDELPRSPYLSGAQVGRRKEASGTGAGSGHARKETVAASEKRVSELPGEGGRLAEEGQARAEGVRGRPGRAAEHLLQPAAAPPQAAGDREGLAGAGVHGPGGRGAADGGRPDRHIPARHALRRRLERRRAPPRQAHVAVSQVLGAERRAEEAAAGGGRHPGGRAGAPRAAGDALRPPVPPRRFLPPRAPAAAVTHHCVLPPRPRGPGSPPWPSAATEDAGSRRTFLKRSRCMRLNRITHPPAFAVGKMFPESQIRYRSSPGSLRSVSVTPQINAAFSSSDLSLP